MDQKYWGCHINKEEKESSTVRFLHEHIFISADRSKRGLLFAGTIYPVEALEFPVTLIT